MSEATSSFFSTLSKKAGLDLAYFVRSGGWVTVRFALLAVLGLVLTVFFARLTDPETYGRYQYILSAVGLLSLLSLPGFNTASLKAVVEGKIGSVRNAIRLSFLFSLLGSVVLLGLAWSAWQGGDIGSALAWLTAGIAFPAYFGLNNWYVFYEGRFDFRASSVRLIGQNVITLAILGLLLLSGAGLGWLVAAYFISGALFNIAYYWEALKRNGWPPPIPFDIRYGIACTLQKSVSVATETIPPLFIGIIFGYAAVAEYQVATFFAVTASSFAGTLASTYLPLLWKYTRVRSGSILFQHLLFGLAMSLAGAVFVQFFFEFFFGEAYQSVLPLAWYTLWIIPFLPLKIFVTNFLVSRQANLSVSLSLSGAHLTGLAWLFWAAYGQHDFLLAAQTYFLLVHSISIILLFLAYWQKTKSDSTTPA